SRREHTRWPRDWSSDVCSSDLEAADDHDQQGEDADRSAYAPEPGRPRDGHEPRHRASWVDRRLIADHVACKQDHEDEGEKHDAARRVEVDGERSLQVEALAEAVQQDV